ncbi:MAG: tRNA pseudouridine(38-40) synthase TruA [Chitinophagales bacterium]|nr:tRNA pseudouridine(38-40) synthase TruA [Chitinophagales bacterium]
MSTLEDGPIFEPKFKRYFIEMAYNGANYHGWQIQPNGISIQQRMNEALTKLLGEDVYCIGCGRTDTGVHARQFFLHFDTSKPITDNLVFRLNRFLGFDIAVKRVIKVAENAHARFDAVERTYQYHMHFKENPFIVGLSAYVYPKPEVLKMKEAAALLLNYTDFKALCKVHDSKTNLCNIYHTSIEEDDEGSSLVFTITANRFLRNMVRMTTGCLIMIGQGKMDIGYFKSVMDQAGSFQYVMPVPACGLYLSSVKYPYL